MKIDCIIVENEPLAAEKVKRFLLKFSDLELLAIFDNGNDALSFLKSTQVDLIFLDINIGKLSGIDLLETSQIKAQVIITTAYENYALKGFELNVTDYLLKPFTFERFFQAVEKAKNNLIKKESHTNHAYIFVKTEYRLEKIILTDILYIEGMGNYRRIHLPDKKIMTLKTFGELCQIIPSPLVMRVHKSFMVALNKIDSIERDRIKINNVLIPISETYKKLFFDSIRHT